MGVGSSHPARRGPAARNADPLSEGCDRERDRKLLHRHRPYLRYDTQDAYRAVSAATAIHAPGDVVTRGDGTIVPSAGDSDRPQLDLDCLAHYPDGSESAERDRLSHGAHSLADIVRMQVRRHYADRVYGRVVRDAGRVWLQYWLWYCYDQKQILGLGGHEGDWEMVQVGLNSTGVPEIVTCAHHESADARGWCDVERRRSASGEHPTIYVAPFSHASYFEPGTHFYLGGVDNPDGQGGGVLPIVEPFGEWVKWPGRWGSSPGILSRWAGGRLGGRSPASPACQHRRWAHPSRWHRRARRRGWRRSARRMLWSLGRASYPSCPNISAGLIGDLLIVDYEMARTVLRRGRYLYITVHLDEHGILAKKAVRARGRSGSVVLTLPYRPPTCRVRTTAFNFARQRSELQEVSATQLVTPRVISTRRDRQTSGIGTEAPSSRSRGAARATRTGTRAHGRSRAGTGAGRRERSPPRRPSTNVRREWGDRS
jgi:hypothetical protein